VPHDDFTPYYNLQDLQENAYRFRCKTCGATTHLSAHAAAQCRFCGSISGAYMPEAPKKRPPNKRF
jgi:hypothetical protein